MSVPCVTNLSRFTGTNDRDGTRARIRETGHLSRPVSRPVLSPRCPGEGDPRFAAWEAAKPGPQVVGGLREQMPTTAALVDELRQVLGTERVNAAIKAGQQAQRTYAAIQAEKGQPAADAWLARQRFPAGVFWASESGHQFGIKRA